MSKVLNSLSLRVSVFFISISTILLGALPSWAASEDVTQDVAPTKTVFRWFAWPGYAFVALTFLVIVGVLIAWYKMVLGPKYRGKKIVS